MESPATAKVGGETKSSGKWIRKTSGSILSLWLDIQNEGVSHEIEDRSVSVAKLVASWQEQFDIAIVTWRNAAFDVRTVHCHPVNSRISLLGQCGRHEIHCD